MRITLGEEAILYTTVASVDPQSGVATLVDDSSLALTLLSPDGTETPVDAASIVHDGTGEYHAAYLPATLGTWRYRWSSDQTIQSASEGSFEVVSLYEGRVSDIRDLRVLVPACRRAIDGPAASAPDSPSTTLADEQVLALVADATAELILNTASADGTMLNAFGNQLVVVERDPFYMAPVAWRTEQERTTAQDAAILSQAALNHYFTLVRTLKVSESLKNEAVDWTYTLSANVIAGWMQYLIDNRNKAVAALQSINVVLDVYVSMVAERDRIAAAWLEPYVSEIGAPVPYVGGGGSGPLEYDYRFNTWG